MVNSSVSKQWFCDRYAINALSVHGGGAEFVSTSCNVGLRGQYGPEERATLIGLEGKNSAEDMKPSSSASHSDNAELWDGDDSLDDVARYKDGGFCFNLLIAFRRYLIRPRPFYIRLIMPRTFYN